MGEWEKGEEGMRYTLVIHAIINASRLRAASGFGLDHGLIILLIMGSERYSPYCSGSRLCATRDIWQTPLALFTLALSLNATVARLCCVHHL